MSIYINLYKSGVYHPKDVLEGIVVVVLNTNKNIRGIKLKIVGEEHTSWEKRESYYDSVAKETKWKTIHYSGDNKFFTISETLYGAGMINLGKHEYPFRFALPKNIPGTYKGAHGNIKYYLKAKVDIPMARDYETKKTFTVMSFINFNDTTQNIVMNPTQYQDETNLCCCCCASDPITADFYMEKEAFILGETIKIKLHITNMSNASIPEIKVELKRTITERCTSPSSDEKIETDLIICDRDTGVGAHGERDYNIAMKIPTNLDLPNFAGCALFSQKFVLKIIIVIPGCHSNMEMIIPVKLGHIGIEGQISTQNQQRQGMYNTPVVQYPPGDSAPPYPTGTHVFPVPISNPSTIGFSVPNPPTPFAENDKFPGVHVPSGYRTPNPQGGSSTPYPIANAPSNSGAPSAPSEAELAAGDHFIVLNDPERNAANGLPPPSYYDAISRQNDQ